MIVIEQHGLPHCFSFEGARWEIILYDLRVAVPVFSGRRPFANLSNLPPSVVDHFLALIYRRLFCLGSHSTPPVRDDQDLIIVVAYNLTDQRLQRLQVCGIVVEITVGGGVGPHPGQPAHP
jgi:hypothetical protein